MNPLRYLLVPWWALQLATDAKSFRDNPLIGSRRLNAWGLHVSRVWLADRMAMWRRRRLAHLIKPKQRAAFDRDGFVMVRDFLPDMVFQVLRDQVMNQSAPAREMVQGDTITRRFAFDPAALNMTAAKWLLADPRWQGLIRYVGSYDTEPLVYIQSILTHRYDAPPDPQTKLHADTFHATVKAWLFLTDVAPDEGPLTYVAGSHRRDAKRLAWEKKRSLEARDGDDFLSARGSLRIEESELAELGLPKPTVFAVPANTLVVCDTSGFHARGPAVRPSTRVEMWAYGRRNPFLPWTGFDLTGWPGLAERRVPIHWAFRDRFKRWIGQPWADAGHKRPADG